MDRWLSERAKCATVCFPYLGRCVRSILSRCLRMCYGTNHDCYCPGLVLSTDFSSTTQSPTPTPHLRPCLKGAVGGRLPWFTMRERFTFLTGTSAAVRSAREVLSILCLQALQAFYDRCTDELTSDRCTDELTSNPGLFMPYPACYAN